MQGSVTIGAVSTVAVAANPSRTLLVLSNASNENISISPSAAAVLNSGIVLKPLGPPLIIDQKGPLSAFLHSPIFAICTSGQKALAYLEV